MKTANWKKRKFEYKAILKYSANGYPTVYLCTIEFALYQSVEI